jgi:hypothetical protein
VLEETKIYHGQRWITIVEKHCPVGPNCLMKSKNTYKIGPSLKETVKRNTLNYTFKSIINTKY